MSKFFHFASFLCDHTPKSRMQNEDNEKLTEFFLRNKATKTALYQEKNNVNTTSSL
jgi:hypothetical protein